ncbi:winged helix-turn-helix transcriptional regulator [Candidatus Bathyarchaeota archaeon]|nr:winged helix-turn-helix transcriptional regulator [Candidatus Bathyarchaeota archaeon]
MSEPQMIVQPITRDAFKLLEDETRRQIVFMLRDEALTVKDIARRLSLTPQNIYHHMNKLQDTGIVRLSYERRDGHIIESFYSTSADNFVYNEDRIPESTVRSYMDILNGLNELGHGLDASLDTASQLEELYTEYLRGASRDVPRDDVCEVCSFSGFFMKFGPMNNVLLNRVLHMAALLEMTDEEFGAHLDRLGEVRRFLKSMKKVG